MPVNKDAYVISGRPEGALRENVDRVQFVETLLSYNHQGDIFFFTQWQHFFFRTPTKGTKETQGQNTRLGFYE